jgi:SAM-dependent methyltransferase
MKNPDSWKPSKFIHTKDGNLIASRDVKEVSPSSRFIAGLAANWYNTNIRKYAYGRLLDLGCGKAPLYATYKPFVQTVTLADWGSSLHENKHLDVMCDITKKLPFNSESFDTILLSDVLEHIPNPADLMSEIERILAPGGVVLVNVPFLYWLHETPHDYCRYTEYMLRKLTEDSGLSVNQIEVLGGGYAVLVDLLSKLVQSKRGASVIQSFLPKIFANKLNERAEFPIGYAMVCHKIERGVE